MFSRRALRQPNYAANAIVALSEAISVLTTRITALEMGTPAGNDLVTWERFQQLANDSTDFADFVSKISVYDPNAAT